MIHQPHLSIKLVASCYFNAWNSAINAPRKICESKRIERASMDHFKRQAQFPIANRCIYLIWVAVLVNKTPRCHKCNKCFKKSIIKSTTVLSPATVLSSTGIFKQFKMVKYHGFHHFLHACTPWFHPGFSVKPLCSVTKVTHPPF